MQINPQEPSHGNTLSTSKLPWTDFHIVLCVSREASVAKACRLLDMTHSTLLRKLETIEARLKTRLFERVRGRYSLTPAGHEIAQAALAMEPLAKEAETRASGQDLQPSGDVRVSVAAVVLDHLLPPVLAQFRSAFPQVRLELATSREMASLRRREADVAIRIADSVPEWLVGRRLVDVQFKVYTRRHTHSAARLRSVAQLAREPRWIAFEQDARDLKFDRWLAAEVPDEHVVLRVDSFSHALSMVRAGLGIALLPVFLETDHADLQALTPPIAPLETPLWLVTHPELRNTTRVQVMMRAFGPALAHAVQLAQARQSP